MASVASTRDNGYNHGPIRARGSWGTVKTHDILAEADVRMLPNTCGGRCPKAAAVFGHGQHTTWFNPGPVRARGFLRPAGDAAGRPSTTAGRSPQRRARGTKAAGRPSTTQPSPDDDEVLSSSESSLSATAFPSCTAASSSDGSPVHLAMQFRWSQYFVVLAASPKVCTTAHHTDAHIHFHAQVRAAGRNILIHVNLHRAAHCD